MNYKFYLLLVYAILFIKCTSSEVELTLNSNELIIYPGTIQTIKIQSGNGKYRSFVEREEVLEVVINGNEIELTGKVTGFTTVTISDGKKNEIEFKVLVYDIGIYLTNYYSTLVPGQKDTIAIYYGNGDYKVYCPDGKIAKVELEDEKIILTAIGEGLTRVYVSDKYGESQVIQMMVLPKTYEEILRDPTPRVIWSLLPEGEFNDKGSYFSFLKPYTFMWSLSNTPIGFNMFFDDYNLGSDSKIKSIHLYSEGDRQVIELDRLRVLKKTDAAWFEVEKDGEVGILVNNRNIGFGNRPSIEIDWAYNSIDIQKHP